MSKQMIIMLEVNDSVGTEALHEALCKILHEGYCYDDTDLGQDWLSDIQVVGSLERTE